MNKILINPVILLALPLMLSAPGCKKDENYTLAAGNGGATASIGNVVSLPIPDRYIFTLSYTPSGTSYESRKSEVMNYANGLLQSVGLPGIQHDAVFASSIVGFVATATPAQAVQLKQMGAVAAFEQDQTIGFQPFNLLFPGAGASPAQTEEYGVRRTGKSDGTGKKAWIIDTGVDLDHEDLNVDAAASRSFVLASLSADDDNGHGTHVAGIVAAKNNAIGVVGVAPNATLVAVKVLAANGSGQVSDVIRGVDYVAGNASSGNAANISIGGGVSDALDAAVMAMAAKGIYTAVAAGNSSAPVSTSSPGRANGPYLFTVSAMDANDNFASFSNFGSTVDYCEPGVNIKSTYMGNTYQVLSGTSMASPHLCGVLLITNGSPRTDGSVIGDRDGIPDPIGVR